MNSPASSKSLRAFAYWLAVAALFMWAAWRRFSLPLDPIADLDTWGYLSPALRKLTGAEFAQFARGWAGDVSERRCGGENSASASLVISKWI